MGVFQYVKDSNPDAVGLFREGINYNSCLLCHDAPCSKVCDKCDPARILRALRFENPELAQSLIPDDFEKSWVKEAEKLCPANVRIGDVFIWVRKMAHYLEKCKGADEIDLSCDICGVKLENPFLLSSSVVASNYDMCARAFEMGWAGAAFKTISMIEMHEASPRFSATRDPYGTWHGFKNIEQLSVRLGMKFIEHNSVNIEAVLGIRFSRKHLIKTIGRQVNNPLGC